MADQHIGYPGSVNSAQLATWVPNVGIAQYSVEGLEDGRVVTNGIGDRGVTVKAGTVIGDGIVDVFENDANLNFASVASGAPDRWDMVVLRRTWNATPGASTSEYVIIQGGPNKTLPTRNNSKGVLADQPMALCRLKAGQSSVQEVIDLRVWAHNAGMVALDDLVLNYLDNIATKVSIGNKHWINTPSVANNQMFLSWVDDNGSGPWSTLTQPTGWVSHGVCRARTLQNGKFLQVAVDAHYEGGPNIFENWVIANLPAAFKPAESTFVTGTTNGYRSGTFYVVGPAGITVGPYPVGTYVQLNGIVPLR